MMDTKAAGTQEDKGCLAFTRWQRSRICLCHTLATKTQSPVLVWFEEGWGGVYLCFFSKPTLNVTPINQISYLRHSGDDCTLKSATKAVSITAARKEKNARRPFTAGGPKIRSPIEWHVEICLPLPPILSLAPADSNEEAR